MNMFLNDNNKSDLIIIFAICVVSAVVGVIAIVACFLVDAFCWKLSITCLIWPFSGAWNFSYRFLRSSSGAFCLFPSKHIDPNTHAWVSKFYIEANGEIAKNKFLVFYSMLDFFSVSFNSTKRFRRRNFCEKITLISQLNLKEKGVQITKEVHKHVNTFFFRNARRLK